MRFLMFLSIHLDVFHTVKNSLIETEDLFDGYTIILNISFFKINSRSEGHDFWLEKNKRKFLPTIIKFITLITFEGNFDFPVEIWRNRRKRGDPIEKFTEQLVCLIVVAIEWNRRRRVGYKQDFESHLYLGNRERETIFLNTLEIKKKERIKKFPLQEKRKGKD